ncbi:phosphoribosylformylglycinamidine synthase [Heliorestis acidaminivorans]|uniref:Phosphoribosylformylglycinamidine synthase n=1 Tax=Heliorestis acidaminivorans TaxID=553427 RepID=A0A6I0F1N3_9FIRM|nr:phosphoribosylformylglycinamidine synthase [Heliorestis acidaminivorans]KAB2952311.1 phosphoribosylformylglycinamidine synthase [Heliorestis acidaminivorans]
MAQEVRRIYVEKKKGFDVEARSLYADLKENLAMQGLTNVRIVQRYDIAGMTDDEYMEARNTIFSEPTVDQVYDETYPLADEQKVFAWEYLPGQYDQRADSAAQSVQLLTQKDRPDIQTARLIVLEGSITTEEIDKIKSYIINPVEAREAILEKPQALSVKTEVPADVEILHGFIDKSEDELQAWMNQTGLAMNLEDLIFCQTYFRDVEKRNPSITEIKVIDTYWSDHCRHTTFLTRIEGVEIEAGSFTRPIRKAYEEYIQSRTFVYGDKVAERDQCLMDIAVLAMKELRKKGLLEDLDVSDEINACSIVVPVDRDGETEEWLIMFKNETHNHPTEIEPFGGAATCLGGAIRDPLSGRSYVYQAMRVTGSGDPRQKIEDTLPGKLPQRKITIGAAAGYSSYGNQIGLATGQVAEVYDEGFVAKRMEIGAVIAAAPKANVVRKKPVAGDVIVLVGGRTGRDGCGGATGSSKEHTEDSLFTCGAEVQKGNPPTERKIQRLFRNQQVSQMIKKCNDFGAGGVSVAIGELTEGLHINLDAVPRKYEGLDGTELAISESQERMAVVIAPENVEAFQLFAREENVEATVVATVTDERRLKMFWRGQAIVDVSRDFLDTNGVQQKTTVTVSAPEESANYFQTLPSQVEKALPDVKEAWLANLEDLNVCSQKGLVERFDSTIGAASVLLPFGGVNQSTPAEGMVAKVPVLNGETKTATAMTYGYDPKLASWSPFHGALYAVVEAVAKIVALGGDYRKVRLTLQEYFEKLGQDSVKWGKPFSALLGAHYVQKALKIPAIGGKDSMSGTFKDLHVPPTLVAFAVNVLQSDKVVSQEFKQSGSQVVLLPLTRDAQEVPSFEQLDKNYGKVYELVQKGQVLAAQTVRFGGLAGTISKMAFGNSIGMAFQNKVDASPLFSPEYGSIILEIPAEVDLAEAFDTVSYELLGKTTVEPIIAVNGYAISLSEGQERWEKPLEKIFPSKADAVGSAQEICFDASSIGATRKVKSSLSLVKPRVFIPVFPGTNCEYDTAKAFEKAGAQSDLLVVRNLTALDVEESIDAMVKAIEKAQMIVIPGGFSAGDEPEGSGKFIATFFRNPRVKEAVTKLLEERDGLMLGICNGFQALIKLGLVPYGEIREITEDSPTLTFNNIGRHISSMVRTKVVSNLSPWFNEVDLGDIHSIAMSHGEGRFVAKDQVLNDLIAKGQIATQYVDQVGKPSMDMPYNPNGSVCAIEGITSPDGRILGKMGHSERIGNDVAINIPGEKDQKIFQSGVNYFK